MIDPVIRAYMSALGKKSYKAKIEKYGKKGFVELQKKAVQARIAKHKLSPESPQPTA